MREISPLEKKTKCNSCIVLKRKRFMADEERKENAASSMVAEESRTTASVASSFLLSLPPPVLLLNSSFTRATCCGYCALYSIPEKCFFLFLLQVQKTRFIEQCERFSSSFSLLEWTREILPPNAHFKAHSDYLRWKLHETTREDENGNCQPTGKKIKEVSLVCRDECMLHCTFSCAKWPSFPPSVPLFTPFSLFLPKQPAFLFFLSTPILPSTLSPSSSSSLSFSCHGSGTLIDSSHSVVIPSHLLVLLASPFLYWSGAAWTAWKIQQYAGSDGVSTSCLFHCPPCGGTSWNASSAASLSRPSPSPWRGNIQGQTTVCWLRVHALRPWLLFFCQEMCHSLKKEVRPYDHGYPFFSAHFSSSSTSSSPFHASSFRSPAHHTAALCAYIIRHWWEPYSHSSRSLCASTISFFSPFPSIFPCLHRWYEVGRSVVGDEECGPLLEGMTFLRGHPRIVIDALALTLPPTSTEARSHVCSADPSVIRMAHSRLDGCTKDHFHHGNNSGKRTSPAGFHGRMAASGETNAVHETAEDECVEDYHRRVHSHWVRLLPYVPTSMWPIIAAGCGWARTDVFAGGEEKTVPPPIVRPQAGIASYAVSPSSSCTCSPLLHGAGIPEEEHQMLICDALETLLLKSYASSLQFTHGRATSTTTRSPSTAQDVRHAFTTTVEMDHTEPSSIPFQSLSANPEPSPEDGVPHASFSAVASQQWWARAEDKIHFLMSLWCRVRYPEGVPYLLSPEEEDERTSHAKKSGFVSPSAGSGAPPSTWTTSTVSSAQESPHNEAKGSMECEECCLSSNSLPSCSSSPPYFVLPFFLLCRSLCTAVGKNALPSTRCFSSSPVSCPFPFTLESRVAKNDAMQCKEATVPFFFPMLTEENDSFKSAVTELAHNLFPSTEELQRCRCKVEHALKILSPL